MAFILDLDLSILQLLVHQDDHAKCYRLCCTTAVCEDIWKKFAFEDVEVYPIAPLYPTPPVLPQLSPEAVSDCEEKGCYLEQITKSLFDDHDGYDYKDENQQLDELESHQNLLRSVLIQVRLYAILLFRTDGFILAKAC